MSKNEVSTLKKGLRVLEYIASNDGVTLNEVMTAQQLSKSTAFRLLSTLAEMNYIYKIQTHYYVKPNHIPNLRSNTQKNEWTALNSLYKTAHDMDMSIYLGKTDGTDLVMTQVLHSPYNTPDQNEVGNRSKLHLSALGKVILAHLDEDALEAILSKLALEPATENTFQDSQLFRYHLKAIGSDGHAFDDEERNVGIRCVAVPVYRHDKVIAALAVAAPAEEISRSNISVLAKKLHSSSKDVTAELETLNK